MAERVESGVARMVAEISRERPYRSVLVYSADGDLSSPSGSGAAVPAPAPPIVLAVPRAADVARFDALSAGFGAVLELPFDKRLLFNVLHAVSAAERGGARWGDSAAGLCAGACAQGAARRSLKVLVADDNATNRDVLGRILERAGHSCDTGGGRRGRAGCDSKRHPSTLSCSIATCPTWAASRWSRRCVRCIRRNRAFPTMIVSADVTPEGREECLDAGADGFLGKPVEAARLLSEVQRIVAAAQAANRRPYRARSPRVWGRRRGAVVNAETLAHLEELGSSPGFIEKLVGVFLADNATLVAKMETAVSAQAFKEFRSLLHALKGSSASMGTDRLTRLCTSLGALNDGEMRLQAAGLLRSLTQELGAARSELERYIAERRRSTG